MKWPEILLGVLGPVCILEGLSKGFGRRFVGLGGFIARLGVGLCPVLGWYRLLGKAGASGPDSRRGQGSGPAIGGGGCSGGALGIEQGFWLDGPQNRVGIALPNTGRLSSGRSGLGNLVRFGSLDRWF